MNQILIFGDLHPHYHDRTKVSYTPILRTILTLGHIRIV